MNAGGVEMPSTTAKTDQIQGNELLLDFELAVVVVDDDPAVVAVLFLLDIFFDATMLLLCALVESETVTFSVYAL